MAESPMKLQWDFNVKRIENVQNTGGFTHCSSSEAKSLFVDEEGIKAVPLHFEEGHWKDAVADEPVLVTDDEAKLLCFKSITSKATFAVMADNEKLYLMR